MGTTIAASLNEEACWDAVRARDARLDGAFVYGVRSTGIYCRPSCPSRRPVRRASVLFFPAIDAAEQAGFRACRRCRPGQNDRPQAASKIRLACDFIRRHSDEAVTLAALGRHVGMSPYHLQRTFSRLLGLSPRQFGEACRLAHLRAALKEGKPVTTAIYDVGYGSSSRVYERANSALGMTPATYRNGGRGMRIAFTIVDSPFGRLLIAATELGISSVKLGARDAALEADLRKEYPAASIECDAHAPVRWARALVDHLQSGSPHLDLPLDVQATAFQWRVWRHLRTIPYGRTESYGEVARRIGRPSAARAVARACASNPVALVIPCHRVVEGSGGPGGYRWGIGRKQAILAREREQGGRRAKH